jgi:hypothetical protein
MACLSVVEDVGSCGCICRWWWLLGWCFLFSQDQLVCVGVSAILNLTPGTAPP